MKVKFNQLDNDTIQIYGDINGVAWRTEEKNRNAFLFRLSFVKNNKLYKIENLVNRTIGNIEELEEKIIKIYNEADYDLENEKEIELDEMEYER